MAIISFDLDEGFSFYGAFHHDWRNKLIHFIFVPVLMFSAFAMIRGLEAPSMLTGMSLSNCPLDFGFLYLCAVSLYWVLLEPVAGACGSVFYFTLWTLAYSFFSSFNGVEGVSWALCIHIIAWMFQFFGHGHFEGRKPALLDNIFQAIAMAPLFVVVEYMFLLGYRPEYQEKMEKQILSKINDLNSAEKSH